MSMIGNLVNQIAQGGLSGITNSAGFDMQDDTFAKLLDKQMNQTQTTPIDSLGTMGIPAGLIIEPLDGTEFSNTVQDQMETIGDNKISKEEYINQPLELKDIDMGDYFSNLLKTNNNDNSDFMNFAKKHAATFYNQQSKNLITSSAEFVFDVLKK